jgi:3-methylcrotonyl-CoA carboxylase alpha subunit
MPIDVEHGNDDGTVRAPMHGKVLAILVEPGDAVAKGQRLAIIEAMKMEHTLTAPIAGTISDISVTAGKQVAERSPILVVRRNMDDA